MTRIIACSIMITMILSSAAAFAEDTHKIEEDIFDVIAVRPLGFVTLSIGTAFFIVSLPVAVISGSTDKTAKTMVADPFNYTFTRPVGDFGQTFQHIDWLNDKNKDSSQ